MIRVRTVPLAAAGWMMASVSLGSVSFAVSAAEAATALAPHKAVYDLKLVKSMGKRPIEAVRGRILYEFSGSSCEGYTLTFRQVFEIDNGEGKVALSDLRATTWEEGDAKSFRFNSENKVDDQTAETVDGRAGRGESGVAVTLSKPRPRSFDLDAAIVFPTEHMRRIIEGAEAGKTLLELPVFDGSDSGDKVFSTLTVIGKVINPGEKRPDDAAAGNQTLAGLRRWPVNVSYFEQDGSGARTGEQTPTYAIGFELYENGITRAPVLDYGDFVVSGRMSELNIEDPPACK
jgi:hypothetical protein